MDEIHNGDGENRELQESKDVAVHAVFFHGDRIEVVMKDGIPHVPMKPLCTRIGLDWESQRQLLKRDEVRDSTACMIQAVGEDGKIREMLSLPLEYLNGWLFKVDVARYEGELKETLIRYQRECYRVLARHFMGRELEGIMDAVRAEVTTLRTALVSTNARLENVVRSAGDAQETARRAEVLGNDAVRLWHREMEYQRKQHTLLEDLRQEMVKLSEEFFVPLPMKALDYNDIKIRLLLVDNQVMIRADDFLRVLGKHKYGSAQTLTVLGFEKGREFVIKTAEEMGNMYAAKPGYVLSRAGFSKITKYISLITPAGMGKASGLSPEFGRWVMETALPAVSELYAIQIDRYREEAGHDD